MASNGGASSKRSSAVMTMALVGLSMRSQAASTCDIGSRPGARVMARERGSLADAAVDDGRAEPDAAAARRAEERAQELRGRVAGRARRSTAGAAAAAAAARCPASARRAAATARDAARALLCEAACALEVAERPA